MPHSLKTRGTAGAMSIDDEPAIHFRQYLWRPVLLTAGAAVYWGLYRAPWVFPDISIIHTTAVFAGVAGYLLGFVSGTTASIAGLFLHAVILKQTGHDTLASMWMAGPAAHIGAALTGPLLGRLRRTERRARAEANRRRAFEARLRSSETQYRLDRKSVV